MTRYLTPAQLLARQNRTRLAQRIVGFIPLGMSAQ